LIQAAGCPSLQAIDVSENSGTNITKAIQFPTSLVKIHANRVTWEADSFMAFLSVCDQHSGDNLMTVSVSHAQFSDSLWQSVARDLARQSLAGVASLIWDGNPPLPPFFRNCRDLVSLSVCGSFDEKTLPALVEYIGSVKRLERLNMKGSESAYDNFWAKGDVPICDFRPVIAALTSESLREVDFSLNLLDDSTCDALAHWASTAEHLDFLACDGTTASALDVLLRFGAICEVRERPLRLSYPAKDAQRLSRTGKFEYSRFQELKHTFSNVRKERPKRRPFVQDRTPFSTPFDVFFGDLDDKIPEYLLETRPQEAESPRSASPLKTPSRLSRQPVDSPAHSRSPKPQSGRRPDASPAFSRSPKTVVSELSCDRTSESSDYLETDEPPHSESPALASDSDMDGPLTRSAASLATSGDSAPPYRTSRSWRSTKSEKPVRPVDWQFQVPFSTDIDDSSVVDRLDQLHSIESLLAAVRQGGAPKRPLGKAK
jgi:hypothetical protein